MEYLIKDFNLLKTNLLTVSYFGKLTLLKNGYSTRLKSTPDAKMSADIRSYQFFIILTPGPML